MGLYTHFYNFIQTIIFSQLISDTNTVLELIF